MTASKYIERHDYQTKIQSTLVNLLSFKNEVDLIIENTKGILQADIQEHRIVNQMKK